MSANATISPPSGVHFRFPHGARWCQLTRATPSKSHGSKCNPIFEEPNGAVPIQSSTNEYTKTEFKQQQKSIQTSPWKTASNHRQRSNQPKRKGSKKTAGCILGKVKKLRIHASYHSQEAFQRSGSAPVMRNCATTALQITQKLNNHSMGWLRADRRVRKGWLVTEERETFPDWRTTARWTVSIFCHITKYTFRCKTHAPIQTHTWSYGHPF